MSITHVSVTYTWFGAEPHRLSVFINNLFYFCEDWCELSNYTDDTILFGTYNTLSCLMKTMQTNPTKFNIDLCSRDPKILKYY